jgi:phage gpG-like protein
MLILNISGADLVADKFTSLPAAVTGRVALALGAALPGLQAAAASNIHSRSGRLAASLNTFLEQDDTGAVATLGSDLPYAGAQEYGYQGTVTVRQYVEARTIAFGRPIRAGVAVVTVRAHVMRMNIPGQSYLRDALADDADSILDQLNDAVAEAIES